MNIGGRYTMARLYGAQGVSARMVLSRPRTQWPARLTRYAEDDWVVLPSGLAVPALRGGAGWSGGAQMPTTVLGHPVSFPGLTTLALSSNYVYNTSGNAVAARPSMYATRTLNTVYHFLSAHSGTPDLLCELRNEGASKPGATLINSKTVSPGGTGWKMFTGFSDSLAAGTKFWVVIGDPDGATNGTATVARNPTNIANTPDALKLGAFSTTDGWATVVTGGSAQGSIVLAFADGTALGCPITTYASFASSTNRRGWNISAGFTETLTILGLVNGTGAPSTNYSGVEATLNNASPGTAAASGTTAVYQGPAAAGALLGYLFDTPSAGYTVPKATPVRIVFTLSGAATSGHIFQIGTGVDATLCAALWGGGNNSLALANGTTNWANDVATAQFSGHLIVEDQVEVLNGSLRTRPRLTLATHGVL